MIKIIFFMCKQLLVKKKKKTNVFRRILQRTFYYSCGFSFFLGFHRRKRNFLKDYLVKLFSTSSQVTNTERKPHFLLRASVRAASVIQDNAAAMFCCEMFCALCSFTLLSVSMRTQTFSLHKHRRQVQTWIQSEKKTSSPRLFVSPAAIRWSERCGPKSSSRSPLWCQAKDSG